jgi:hypothetical protein
VHVNDLLARWQTAVADVYIKFGAAPPVADEHSTVMLAALEGALILARAQRSTHPLDTVERHFADRAPGSPGGVIPRRWLTTDARPAAQVLAPEILRRVDAGRRDRVVIDSCGGGSLSALLGHRHVTADSARLSACDARVDRTAGSVRRSPPDPVTAHRGRA